MKKIIGYVGMIAFSISILFIIAVFNNRVCIEDASFTSDLDYVVSAHKAHNRHSESVKFKGDIIGKVHLVSQNGDFVEAYRIYSRKSRDLDSRGEMLVILGRDDWAIGRGFSKKITVLGKNDAYMSYFTACGELDFTTR